MENQEDQAALVIKYFLDHFPLDLFTGKQSPANKHEELANKYLTQITEVFSVFDRLCRYEKYFSDFIPSKESGISESEAIEYHLRNYVQEFYILRERIHKIADSLKEDLSYFDILNSKDVEKALEHIKKNVDANFKKINDKLRREHVHERSISDFDLVRGKFFAQLLSGEVPIPAGTSLDMEKIKELYGNVVDSSKDKYTQQAIHNSIGIKKGKQFFAARFGHLFASLNGHNGNIFDMNAGFEKGLEISPTEVR